MKRIIIIIISILLIFLQGCQNTQLDNDLKFAFITDTTGKNEQIDSSIVEAFEEIQGYYNFKYKIFTPKDSEDCIEIINSLYVSDYDLILGASYRVNNNLIQTVGEYPDVDIALIGNDEKSNWAMTVDFKTEESSFLAGILAASMSKNAIIGYVGAYQDEDADYEIGYRAGALTYNPDIKIISYYTGSYNNVSQGYKVANDLVDMNADVIFTNCGASALGIGKSAIENDFYMIYSDQYVSEENPKRIGTMTIDYKKVALYIIDNYINKDYKSGNNRFGIAYDMVDLITTDDVSQEIKDVINEYRTQIRKFSITIPRTTKELDNFDYLEFIQ